MSKEIEIRAVIENRKQIEVHLIDIGFERSDDITQMDIMLDRPDGSLFNSGRKIRLRLEGESGELTYKGHFEGDTNASRRIEVNFGVSPEEIGSITEFFSAIGFHPLFTIPKTRTKYHLEDVLITFDEWPIIGCLMELEGPENNIRQLADELCPGVEFRGYRLKDLFLNKVAQTGKPLSQLQQEFELEKGTKLGRLDLLIQ